MQVFISEFSDQIKAGRHAALVIDNAGSHTAKDLIIPNNITLIPLPPYSPELKAMEQVWEWIKLHTYQIVILKIMMRLLTKYLSLGINSPSKPAWLNRYALEIG